VAVSLQVRGARVSWSTALATAIPLALVAVARADTSASDKVWSIVRDWLPVPLVLVAYWSTDWAQPSGRDRAFEEALVRWDRILLNDWGLRAAVETAGPLLPTILELAYLVVYAVPGLAIAYLYLRRQRARVNAFLFPFLLGTLLTYALLPYFPSEPPRVAFAGEDLPGIQTTVRLVNLWILDHCDIRASVFPSGHVAAAFSAVFAMSLALPGNRAATWVLLTIALLAMVCTVYGRYHYAGDGLAGLVTSMAACSYVLAYQAVTSQRRG
jgi:membrane-associated phospholipid phosphatase